MAISEGDRVLRTLTILTLIPALAFLIPYSAISMQALQACCLVPGGISAAIGIWHLARHVPSARLAIILDAAMALFLTAMVVPAAVLLESGRWYYRDVRVLGAFGLMPLLFNCCVHIYFALRELNVFKVIHYRLAALVKSPTCPHCQHKVLAGWGMAGERSPSSAASTHHDYVEVEQTAGVADAAPEEYKDARPSTDSETARLV